MLNIQFLLFKAAIQAKIYLSQIYGDTLPYEMWAQTRKE